MVRATAHAVIECDGRPLSALAESWPSDVSRDALVHQVWHEPARSATLDNVIDVHIARLRRKVDLDQRVKLIHTVRGVGFVLREDEP